MEEFKRKQRLTEILKLQRAGEYTGFRLKIMNLKIKTGSRKLNLSEISCNYGNDANIHPIGRVKMDISNQFY